jgi:hypothetical protein
MLCIHGRGREVQKTFRSFRRGNEPGTGNKKNGPQNRCEPGSKKENSYHFWESNPGCAIRPAVTFEGFNIVMRYPVTIDGVCVIGFTDYLQVVTTNNCNTTADFHISQITTR